MASTGRETVKTICLALFSGGAVLCFLLTVAPLEGRRESWFVRLRSIVLLTTVTAAVAAMAIE